MMRCAATDAPMIPKGGVGAFVHSVYHFASIALVDELESFQCQGTTIMFSRRQLLAVSAVGAAMTTTDARAQTFGNPDLPPQGAINAKAPGNLSDPGPHSDAIGGQFPSAQSPPPTDVGGMPLTWASFNNAPKRIQNGGWARQVTAFDFAISTEIAGVNMRLTAGGIRELHWHQAAEWAIMTYGNCRITVLDAEGRLRVTSQRTRDQKRNLDDARDKLRALVLRALERPLKRRDTRPTRASVERRLQDKKRRSRLKSERGGEA